MSVMLSRPRDMERNNEQIFIDLLNYTLPFEDRVQRLWFIDCELPMIGLPKDRSVLDVLCQTTQAHQWIIRLQVALRHIDEGQSHPIHEGYDDKSIALLVYCPVGSKLAISSPFHVITTPPATPRFEAIGYVALEYIRKDVLTIGRLNMTEMWKFIDLLEAEFCSPGIKSLPQTLKEPMEHMSSAELDYMKRQLLERLLALGVAPSDIDALVR